MMKLSSSETWSQEVFPTSSSVNFVAGLDVLIYPSLGIFELHRHGFPALDSRAAAISMSRCTTGIRYVLPKQRYGKAVI